MTKTDLMKQVKENWETIIELGIAQKVTKVDWHWSERKETLNEPTITGLSKMNKEKLLTTVRGTAFHIAKQRATA